LSGGSDAKLQLLTPSQLEIEKEIPNVEQTTILYLRILRGGKLQVRLPERESHQPIHWMRLRG